MNTENDASALAAFGMAADAPEAPESLAELLETARLLRLDPALLATQPEELRRAYAARALASNPGLARFAGRDFLSRIIAVNNAREGAALREAFANPALAPRPERRAESAPERPGETDGDDPWLEKGGAHSGQDLYAKPVPEGDFQSSPADGRGEDAESGLDWAWEPDWDAFAESAYGMDPDESLESGPAPGSAEGFLDEELPVSPEGESASASPMPAPDGESANNDALPDYQAAPVDGDRAAPADALAASSLTEDPDFYETGRQALKTLSVPDASPTPDDSPDELADKSPDESRGGRSPADQLLDPFRNFANGWLDLLKGILGAGKSGADLTAGQDSALSRWFAASIRNIQALEFATARPESFAGRLAQDVVRNAPQLIAQIVAWLGTGPASSLGLIFTEIYGSDYLRHQEAGVNSANAAVAGFMDAALQTAMERIGLHALLRNPALGGALEALGKAGGGEAGLNALKSLLAGSAPVQTALAAARGAGMEGLMEAAQYAPDYLSTFWAQSSLYNDSISDRVEWTKNRVLDAANLLEGTREALYEGLVGAILGAPVAGGHYAWTRRNLDPELRALLESEQSRAEAVTRRLGFEQAMNRARETLQGIRDADQARQLALHSLPEETRMALLDPGDLAAVLGRDPRRAAQILEATGRSVEEINHALDSGLDLEVDLASLLCCRAPEARIIQEALRLENGGPSLGSASAWSPAQRLEQVLRVLDQEDDLQGFSDDERAREEAARTQSAHSMSARADSHVRRLTRQMREAGLPDLEARANASLLRAHALTWWRRYGVDPSLLLAELNVERAQGPLNRGREIGGPEEEALGEDSPDWMSPPPAPRSVLRGQLALGKSGALIRLFQERNVSTLPHESGHLFLQDLMSLVQDGETRVIRNLQEECLRLLGDDQSFMEELDGELGGLRARLGDDPEALRQYASHLLERSRNLEASAGSLRQRQQALIESGQAPAIEDDLEIASAVSRLNASRSLARRARESARWLEALAEARADLQAFAAHAGLDAAGLALAMRAAANPESTDAAELAEYTRLHESTAKAFNSYLAAGKAPSPALAQVMARFRQWLSALWRSYRSDPRVEISQRLRLAFDRLLASDQDLRLQEGIDAFARHERAFLENPALPAEEAAHLKKLLRRAQAGSLDKVNQRLRRQDEKWRGQRAREIYRDLENDPFWLLAEKARFRQEDIDALLGGERGAALRAAWPSLVARRKFSALEETAAEAGYGDAAAMLEDLYSRLVLRHESRRGEAESRADAELRARREQRGEMPYPVNTALEEYLAGAEEAVTRLAARLRLISETEVERWLRDSRVPQSVVDNIAATRIARTPLRQLTPRHLERMLDRSLSRRDQLLASGQPADLMAAMNEANESRVIHAMMQEAASAQMLLGKIRQKGKKIAQSQPGSHGARETEALRKLLSAFGLGTMRAPLDGIVSLRSLSDLVREIMSSEIMGDSLAVFPDWLLETRHPDMDSRSRGSVIPLQALSPSQLQDLFNLMNFLDKAGKDVRATARDSLAARVLGMVSSCVNAMSELPDRPFLPAGGLRDTISTLAAKGFAATDALLWQCRKGDGLLNIMGKGQTGPLELCWQKIIGGEQRVRAWTDKVHRAMLPHLETLRLANERLTALYGRNMRLKDEMGREIRPPEAWRKAYKSDFYTPEMIFTIALHSGSASNLERLMKGYQGEDALDHAQLYRLFGDTRFRNLRGYARVTGAARPGLLTPQEWKAIQGIWDALSLLWPDTRRVHMEMFAYAPEMVPRTSFELLLEDGSTESLEGGYFPVRYDPRISRKVASWTESEELLAMNEAMFIAPSAQRGHTKRRSEQVPGLPMLLNMSPIGEHVVNAARFIELAQTVRLMDQVIMNNDFRNSYIEKFGQEDYAQIRPALRGLLRTERLPDVVAWLESRIRRFVVPWGLSWNLNVALIQSTAVFPAMGDLGPRPLMKAMLQLLKKPSLRKEIWKASPYMLSRMYNLDQDLRRQLEFTAGRRPVSITFRGKSWSYEDLVNLGMKGIVIVDACATCTVWLAAYQSRLAQLRASASGLNPNGVNPSGLNPIGDNQSPQSAPQAAPPESSAESRPQSAPQAAPPVPEAYQPGEIRLSADRAAAPEEGAAQAGLSPEGLNLNHHESQPAAPSALNSSEADISRNEEPSEAESAPAPASPSSSSSIIAFEDAAHAEAALYADTLVKQSNPDFDPSSRSSFLRSRGMMRLFNQFSSAISLFASRNHFMLTAMRKGRISKGRYASHLANDFLYPAVFLFLFYGLARDFHDREGNPLRSFGALLMDQLSMSIPIFGSLASDLTQNALGMGSGNYRRGDLRTSLDAPAQIGKQASIAINRLASGGHSREEEKAAIYALLDTASFLSRIPFSRVAKKAERGYDQYRRGEGTPASILLPKPGR